MCLGVPGRIVRIVDQARSVAEVDVAGTRRTVSTAILDQSADGIGVGDWVEIHLGFALARISEEEAAEALGFLERMGSDQVDEADVFAHNRAEGRTR